MERERIKVYKAGKRKNNYKLKRVLSGVMAAMFVAGSIKYVVDTRTKPKDDLNNINGYSSINFLYNDNAKSNEFVIINAGNYNNRAWYIDSNINYCNKKEISVGVVINSKA